jgi:hypothetical protein
LGGARAGRDRRERRPRKRKPAVSCASLPQRAKTHSSTDPRSAIALLRIRGARARAFERVDAACALQSRRRYVQLDSDQREEDLEPPDRQAGEGLPQPEPVSRAGSRSGPRRVFASKPCPEPCPDVPKFRGTRRSFRLGAPLPPARSRCRAPPCGPSVRPLRRNDRAVLPRPVFSVLTRLAGLIAGVTNEITN